MGKSPIASSRRILVFSHKPFVPIVSGHAVRVHDMLAELVRRGFRVHFYSYDRIERDFKIDGVSVTHVQYPPPTRALERGFLGRIMDVAKSREAILSIVTLHPKLLFRACSELVTSHAVVVEHIWGALLPLVFAKLARKRAVVVDHNAESLLSLRLLATARGRVGEGLLVARLAYTLALEKIACSLADVVVVVSPFDGKWITRQLHIDERKVVVVPNAVNPEIMKSRPELRNAVRTRLSVPEEVFLACFLGDLETPPNRLAAKTIIDDIGPKTLAMNSHVRFIVVGRYEKPLTGESSRGGAIFTNVVEDIQPYLSAADICLAPMEIGGGTKLKLLTYFAFSKPVVATRIAVEGISAIHGTHLIISEPRDFPSNILRLMSDPELRNRLGSAARELVLKEYDSRVVGGRLAEILS